MLQLKTLNFIKKKKKSLQKQKKLNEIIKAQECFTIKNLNVDGKDLIALGIKPGRIQE